MTKKKILLIKVPSCIYSSNSRLDDYATKHTYSFLPSYALAVLSAFLKKNLKIDYELKVVDINMFALSLGSLAIEKFLSYMTKVIKNNNFDILLISCQYMFNQRWVEDAVRIAHQTNSQAKIIIGGGFATIFPEKLIQMPDVDYIVMGESEHTLIHIINRICGFNDQDFERKFPFDGYGQKLSDGSYKIVEKKTFIHNLEELPRPDWQWLDFEEYKKNSSNPYLPFMASRGCPYNCSYCSTKLNWGLRFRCRPVKDVIDEIIWNYYEHGIKIFHYIDDNLIFNKKWFLELCQQLQNIPKDIEIIIYNFSIKQIDGEILDSLKRLRVKRITTAVESGTPEIQKMINKRLNLEEVERKIKLIKKKGFRTHTFWMIGFPNETMEQINQTVNMARKLRTESISMWVVFPFPGTKMYDEAKALHLVDLDENDYESMSYQNAGKILSDEWDGQKLSQIAYDANIELNFLDTPLYDNDTGRQELKSFLEDLSKRISGHVIAFIAMGFLAGRFFNNQLEKEANYRIAYDILKNGSPTFERYMDWDFPQINDFKKWITENGLSLNISHTK